MSTSESILEEAQRLIHGERNKNYGHPRDNFREIAKLFTGYLDREVSELDVANLMILMKVARAKDAGWHRDSYTDIAGYAGCAERLQEPVDVEKILTEAYEGPAKPREWQTLEEVPHDVRVVDPDGDVWTYLNLPTGWGYTGRPALYDIDTYDGPFTEVLDG